MRALVPFLVLALTACPPPVQPPPVPGSADFTGDVLVTLDGEPLVSQGMIDTLTATMPEDQLAQMEASGQLDSMVDNLVTGELLYREALNRGLQDDPEVQQFLAMSAREALARKVLEDVSEEAVTDEAVAAAYEEKKVQFARPMVHARHILVADAATAEQVKAELEAGGDFAALAAQYSTDPGSKDSGGDLGWFEKRRMVAPFGEAAFNAEVGTLVGPIETNFGYHLIEVLDRREHTPLEEVRPQLESTLKNEAVQEYIKSLREGKDIVTVDATPEPATDVLDEVSPPEPAHDNDH